MKKQLCCICMAVLLLGGCGAKRSAGEQPPADGGAQGPIVMATAELSASADTGTHYGVYSLDGGEQTEAAGTYDSDAADEHALLAQDGAVFSVTGADVNKTGDSAGTLRAGHNAAAASVTGAHLLLKDCTLTTNGLAAAGLFCEGEGSRITLENTQTVTAGAGSPALVLADGAAVNALNTRLMSEQADAPLIVCYGAASVTLSGCTLQTASANAVEVRGGKLALILDAQSLPGGVQLLSEGEKPAQLSLTLKNGAAFTGAVLTGDAGILDVSLDATSSWTLTGETTVSALIAPDTKFAGIQSGGFNIYYNAELESNAWLNSQAYLLPGGGCLTPLI